MASGRVGALGEVGLDRAEVGALAGDDALRVEHDDVGGTGGEQDVGAGHAGRTGTRDDDAQAGDVTVLDLDGTLERREHHDGGAVLVVVHDRAVQGLDDALLDLEAAGGSGDVLEVHGTEARAQAHEGLDDLVGGVLGVEHQRDRVQARELLEQGGLASITGSEARGPMSPRPSTAVPSLTTTTRRLVQV